MLSPSSPAQRVSEEDTSGSDTRSDVGQEPETDRFGFILTNGSTAGCVGPAPELVRQREAKWINIISQWDHILFKKTHKVKVQCQKGIPASLRAKCWPLLCGATDKMKQNQTLYQSLDSQPALQSWVDVIERDLDRQFPFHEMFLSKDGHGQRGLFRVLKAYTQYQPEEGYCQAQGPVTAVLLMNMPAEEAFWCLVQISEQYLPGYYSPLLEGVLFDAAMLTWVLKRTCPAAHKHLQQHGVEPLMFATDWLMCLFTRHLPFNTLLRVWDLFFCYGVRVLLQVTVVLVRRVLGRAEQRRQCEGQMETLERLRGVRDQVQEEDDTFIAEVCSVQLSAKDLEKQTEKQLEKWRKDRPLSTFDPRGRCHGYQMAWARARHTEEERDKREREKGNLSVPITRSASTLSLSPSLLHRWRKGGKVNAEEWEGGGKVVRHLSMGAKEDMRGWTELHVKKVKEVQEEEDEEVFEEHEHELLKIPENMDTIQNMQEEHEDEKVCLEVETEKTISEEEERQLRKTEESETLSEQTEEPKHGPTEDQNVENILQIPDYTIHQEQDEELNSDSPSQVLELQSQERQEQEIEVKSENKETEKLETEGGLPDFIEENQTEVQTDDDSDQKTEAESGGATDRSEEQDDVKPENTETENVQQTQVETPPKAINETSPDTEIDSEAHIVRDTVDEIEAQQQQEEEKSSQEDGSEGEHLSNEQSKEIDLKDESCLQTETDVLSHDSVTLNQMDPEIGQRNFSEEHADSETEAEPLILCLPECTEQKESTGLEAEKNTAAQTHVVMDKNEVSSGRESDTATCESTQEDEEVISTVGSEEKVNNSQTQAEKAKTESGINEEATDITRPLTSAEEIDGKSLVPEEPKVQNLKEEEISENLEENTPGGDHICNPTNSPEPDSNLQIKEKESNFEPINSDQTQLCGRRNSKSSGDFCVRKSSATRRSWLGRRLSEDLFTMPQKTNQSQLISNSHSELQANPEVVNQTKPEEIPSPLPAEETIKTPAPSESHPSKRFDFFRRLKGERPNKAKTPMQVPTIVIQDFSDGTGTGTVVEEEGQEKLSSRERRRRRRERERKEKEEERLRKKKEKEQEKERRKPQTRGKSFQGQKEKGSIDEAQHVKTEAQSFRYTAPYAESYF
ncbi:trichohyalin [Cheilinus undulatus]|uniref:trichohyalin n=1 Tax=Cheilinus undulatus TaxID=241271 RepID=UPI001BD39505|nr:trichohyalin [Cheilinus undulatus]